MLILYSMKWEVLNNLPITNHQSLITVLLKNRGLKTKKEIEDFLNPKFPELIKIPKNVLQRLDKANKNKEKIVIYGDYDADGVCATAILWETMYKQGFDVIPFIPDRFADGYGLKADSIQRLKTNDQKLSLVITVDNGIVAYEGIKKANQLGIDVIVVDHHTEGNKKLNTEYILHSTLVCGSALSWFLSQELGGKDGLDLVALGTIADQMPLLGINRSLVKFGLPELLKTKRIGLQKMFRDSKIENVGVYEVGFMIAPRINAMGRLHSATDALRFLCTRDPKKAHDLNQILNDTNIERQKIVDDVLTQVLKQVQDNDKVVVISGDYHEGVIGLASGKITEKFFRPSIVLSVNGETSKASARSIAGFNIIEAIKETELILEGGGHPMAAGFSIETTKIEEFRIKINKLAEKSLTEEVLERKLKVDMEIGFSQINENLVEELKKFEPAGQANYSPVFMSSNVLIKEVKPVGTEGKHLKLKLEQNGIVLDGIWFNSQYKVHSTEYIDIAYTVEENVWNNKTTIQLKIKDIRS
jgi:single-stranded-DNA-specific exonuclease